ncbi:MAG: hypothetical protein IMF12_06385 [Proteobacteria bacterium]|nr:hypothetical protein [Pseudomonadota bacterium]
MNNITGNNNKAMVDCHAIAIPVIKDNNIAAIVTWFAVIPQLASLRQIGRNIF